MKVRREPGGGFRTVGPLEGRGRNEGDEVRFSLERHDATWSVRPRAGGGGFDLFEAGGEAPLAATRGNGRRGLPCTIQLEDGRVFVVESEPHDTFSVFDDAGLGPYWRGRPAADGFEVEPTVAGRHVEAADALLVLLAVHLTRR